MFGEMVEYERKTEKVKIKSSKIKSIYRNQLNLSSRDSIGSLNMRNAHRLPGSTYVDITFLTVGTIILHFARLNLLFTNMDTYTVTWGSEEKKHLLK